MKIVVDSNIVFSFLLNPESKLRDILFDVSNTLYAPNFLMTEIYKHKEKIAKFSKIDETETLEALTLILDRITFVSPKYISNENWEVAIEFCKDVDEKDSPFVALSLELKADLFTNDKKLINHLKQKGFKNIY